MKTLERKGDFMRYNICGYNQKALLNYGLDCNDAMLLRTFMDIYTSSSEKLEYIILNNDKFLWLTYGYISEQLQLLGSIRTVKRKIDNLVEKNILKRVILNSKNKKSGKYMYLAPGENYSAFCDCDFYTQKEDKNLENNIETENKNQMTNTPHQVTDCHKGHDKVSLDLMTSCQVKDSSIIDSSIGDNNNTHTEEKPLPIIADIMKKYNELNLPKYTFRPKDRIIMECIKTLGAVNFFKALEIMSRSSFVKNTFSINMIFKIDNLKNALNGTFNDRKKSPEKETRLNVSNEKTYKPNKNNEELFKLLGMR